MSANINLATLREILVLRIIQICFSKQILQITSRFSPVSTNVTPDHFIVIGPF